METQHGLLKHNTTFAKHKTKFLLNGLINFANITVRIPSSNPCTREAYSSSTYRHSVAWYCSKKSNITE